MSSRRATQSARERISQEKTKPVPRNPRPTSRFPRGKVVGGILIALASIWFVLLLLHQFGVGAPGLSTLPFLPGRAPAAPTTVPASPLAAAGISLGYSTQTPALTQQQALLIASQLEPGAATQAKKTSAQYVLLNYAGTTTSPSLKNIQAWMIVYQQIPLAPGDLSADPTPAPQSYHNLYVFLDANSGKELLAIWAS